MAEALRRARGTPVEGLSGGSFPRTETAAAVAGTTQTITVPVGALYCSLKNTLATKFRGTDSAGADYALAANTELNNIPCSGATSLILFEDSGGAGVGTTSIIWEMGQDAAVV